MLGRTISVIIAEYDRYAEVEQTLREGCADIGFTTLPTTTEFEAWETKKAKKSSKRKAQKTGLNRSMLDVGINNLTKAIEYKLQEAGGFLVYVPTKTVKPSQTCPSCGHQKKKDLSEPVHHCSECGVTYDRDVAAAMVMLSWALFNLRPQSWRRNPYFYPSSYGRLEANFFVEATETHRSRK